MSELLADGCDLDAPDSMADIVSGALLEDRTPAELSDRLDARFGAH